MFLVAENDQRVNRSCNASGRKGSIAGQKGWQYALNSDLDERLLDAGVVLQHQIG